MNNRMCRGKCIDYENYVTGYYIQIGDVSYIADTSNCKSLRTVPFFRVEESTVRRCSGVEDANAKLLFADDVIAMYNISDVDHNIRETKKILIAILRVIDNETSWGAEIVDDMSDTFLSDIVDFRLDTLSDKYIIERIGFGNSGVCRAHSLWYKEKIMEV